VARWREEKREAGAGYPHTWIATGDPQFVAEYRERAFGIPALLFRLLTDDRMWPVWRAVTAAGSVGTVPHTTIFTAAVVRAWMGPWGEERWSPARRATWQRDVAALAERLAGELEGTGADDFLNRSLLFGRGASCMVSGFLRSLARHAQDFLAPEILKRPRAPEARRAYFVRTLKAAYPDLGGLVAVVGAVALEDDALTERQTRRLTRKDSKSARR
jgi:hypothetical protein